MAFKIKPGRIKIDKEFIDSPNLCSKLKDEELKKLGELVYEGWQRDERSRARWKRRTSAAIDFAMQMSKEKTWPWPGCSNVIFPLISIAALQFSSRAYAGLINGTDIVRMRVIGEDPKGNLSKRADRISQHMSWQVLEEDEDWEEEHDRLLIHESIVGCAFVKTHTASGRAHPVGDFVPAMDLCMDYFAKSVDKCNRKTHSFPLYRNEVHERIAKKLFRDIRQESWYSGTTRPEGEGEAEQPLPPPVVEAVDEDTQADKDERAGMEPPEQADESTPFIFREQHRYLDLDGDGYEEPYIVTIESGSRCVVRIVARWERLEDMETDDDGYIICIKPTEYFTKYPFVPSPDGGIYDIGFGMLLGPINEAVNSSINQLVDSGTMNNSLGGFIGKGAKLRAGRYTLSPWEWVTVQSTGDDLRKNLIPHPNRAPSTVLFQMLNLLIEYANRLSSSTDQMVGKTPGQNTPAETSRNALNEGMQVFNAIFKRNWRSMKNEFKKRFKINQRVVGRKEYYGEEGLVVYAEDYKSNPSDLVPVADPNIVSLSMRFFQAQQIREASKQVPGYDPEAVELNFLKALQVQQPKKFYVGMGKSPPPKNPKLAIAEMQNQQKSLALEWQKQEFILSLMQQRKLDQAKIVELTAKAVQIMATVDAEKAAAEMEALQMAIDALNTHQESLNDRIKTLMGQGGEGGEGEETGEDSMAEESEDESGEGEGESSGLAGDEGAEGADAAAGALSALGAGSDDSDVPPVSGEMEGELEGAMGGGDVSGGDE